MRRRLVARRDRERGSEAIEAAIGVPAFLLFIAMIIAAGRFAIAHQAVQAAAADAARAASISRTQGAADSAATSGASSSLANQKLQCVSKKVSVDTSGFAAPVGTPATVTATVTCVVNLSDVAIPGLPGHQTISATMASPLDTYRER
ncbi:TadE/TadG family type IV pilus assembly protein [Actinopolymorpha pittospori]|uniref:Flp pilus assembly protein TadG n=1 Tax=Actinopolymorpha pittospori TaxID=648752 RepID=A0A927RFC1_9ACTN|nr:TadE/TadG family type IV pilus assembly protein [Actinopolymorpha pittospori]MBE1610065.1 Flp pilus assembly protein TadG [Actinopolymorpha pittospori]